MIHHQWIDVATRCHHTSVPRKLSHEIAHVENRRESGFIGLSLFAAKPVAAERPDQSRTFSPGARMTKCIDIHANYTSLLDGWVSRYQPEAGIHPRSITVSEDVSLSDGARLPIGDFTQIEISASFTSHLHLDAVLMSRDRPAN